MKKAILIILHAIFSLICAFSIAFITFTGFTYTKFALNHLEYYPAAKGIIMKTVDFLFIDLKLDLYEEAIYYWCASVIPILSMLILCIGSGILLYKYCRMTEAEKTAVRNRQELIRSERRAARNARQHLKREKALEKTKKKALMLEEKLNNTKSDE